MVTNLIPKIHENTYCRVISDFFYNFILTFFEFKMDLRIGGVTFNVAEEPPSRDIGTRLIDETGNKPDVFIVALQEVNLGLQIGALLFWDQWTEKVRIFID